MCEAKEVVINEWSSIKQHQQQTYLDLSAKLHHKHNNQSNKLLIEWSVENIGKSCSLWDQFDFIRQKEEEKWYLYNHFMTIFKQLFYTYIMFVFSLFFFSLLFLTNKKKEVVTKTQKEYRPINIRQVMKKKSSWERRTHFVCCTNSST